ncbi:MAG: NEW3 domain-containing protein [Chitinophagaceae bacterium]|nr:NEW3 domain-containing protein [Chitinophagaceae bacterium]
MLANKFYTRQNYYRVFIFCLLSFYLFSPAHAQQRKSTFTARLINIESVVKDPFRYNLSLYNGSGHTQIYALQTQAPDGWMALFRTDGSQVAALKLDSGKTQDIATEIMASPFAKPGKYTIPVTAISSTDTLRLELEAVVKGSYGLELTTPTGRLSDDITEGSSRQLRLTAKNTGTLPLDNLELSAQSPTQWSASFALPKIERLDPGQSQDIEVKLSVPDKTIAGDYMTTFTAKNNYTSANATFRMTVKTSLLSGWIGILVILLALGMVYYLIRKYGRR